MAKGALFLGWGTNAVNGREEATVRVFNESIQYYMQLQQEGQIDSFEPVFLEPHGGDLGGFILMKGDRDKLNQIRYSDEFVRLTNRAASVIDNIGIVSAYVGEEMERFVGNILPNTQDLIS